MNEEKELKGKDSSEKISYKINNNNNPNDGIVKTIEEEQKPKSKKFFIIKVKDIIFEDNDESDEEGKEIGTDEIPQSIDSTNEIEKLARQNIKFSIEEDEDNEKNCENPSGICNTICLIF